MYIWSHIGMYINVNASVGMCVLYCIEMYNVWRASDESNVNLRSKKKRNSVPGVLDIFVTVNSCSPFLICNASLCCRPVCAPTAFWYRAGSMMLLWKSWRRLWMQNWSLATAPSRPPHKGRSSTPALQRRCRMQRQYTNVSVNNQKHTHTEIMWLRWWLNGVDQLFFLSGGEPDCRCCGTGSSHSSRWEETGGLLHAAHPAVQCRHWYAVHARGDLWTPYSCC